MKYGTEINSITGMSTFDNSDTTIPVRVSIKEAGENFFKELEKIHSCLSIENYHLDMKENWFWGGGKNVEINDHTLVIQHVPSVCDASAKPYISLALYDLKFDENGRAYNLNGKALKNFDFEKHCLLHQEIEPFVEEDHIGWCDRAGENRYTTDEFIKKWVQELLKRSSRD